MQGTAMSAMAGFWLSAALVLARGAERILSFGRAIALIACAITLLPHAVYSATPTQQEHVAFAYKMAGDANRMRVVIHFERDPQARWFLLQSPHRMVIDLPRTKFGFDPASLKPRGMISNIRYGLMSENASRMVVGLDGPFEVESFRTIRNETMPGYRLIIDLISVSTRRFSELLADQAQVTGSTVTAKADRLGLPDTVKERKFTVVIDPGHGGIDSGATGKGKSVEKWIVLSFAKELKKQLELSEKYNVFLTREEDIFLRLDERVRIARQHEADLFISIHADKVAQNWVRGATVYTLSEKASDAVAHAVAQQENLSDAIAGVELVEEQKEVADILLDLVQRETKTFSARFARDLVKALEPSVEMIKNSHRSAGFRVLRAYDVPSVLLELGYMSNPRDAEQMQDGAWREKFIAGVVGAIDAYRAIRFAGGGG